MTPKTRLIGYARVSTTDQDLSIQKAALTKHGVLDRDLYCEKVSGKKTDREMLNKALDACRAGDCFIVTRLDRLGRSLKDLANIAHRLDEESVSLSVIEQNVDTGTSAGKAFFGMLAVFAQFETDVRKERQAEGISRIIADPKLRKEKYKGNTKQIPRERIIELHAEGWKPSQIVDKLKDQQDGNGLSLSVSRTSVWRILKELEPA